MRGVLLIAAAATVFSAVPQPVLAHSGGLNAQGCHNNRQTGGYHCHRSGGAQRRTPQTATPQQGRTPSGAYVNCAAARAAGAAPVRRGDPGYGAHLDRDNDGVGCEN